MNKKSVLGILLGFVFLVAFNCVFFIVGGTDRAASVWISYGFVHFAYLMVLVTPFLVRTSSSAAVFGFTLYSISSAYFLLEFAVGLVLAFMKIESCKSALVVQIIIAGIYAMLLLSHLIANEHTADSVERHEEEVAYIKTASSRVKALVGKANGKKANKGIEKAYDILHCSPSKTAATVRSIESDVMNRIAELEGAVFDQDTARIVAITNEIVVLMNERNLKLGYYQ